MFRNHVISAMRKTRKGESDGKFRVLDKCCLSDLAGDLCHGVCRDSLIRGRRLYRGCFRGCLRCHRPNRHVLLCSRRIHHWPLLLHLRQLCRLVRLVCSLRLPLQQRSPPVENPEDTPPRPCGVGFFIPKSFYATLNIPLSIRVIRYSFVICVVL